MLYLDTAHDLHANGRILKTLIIIGDGALAKELMEKRWAKYSGRPVEPYMVRSRLGCLTCLLASEPLRGSR